MLIINEQWLKEILLCVDILNRGSTLTINRVGAKTTQSSRYMVLQLYVQGNDKNMAAIKGEFHVVSVIGCKMIIRVDILKPHGITMNFNADRMTVNLYIKENGNSVVVRIRVIPKGRRIMHCVIKTLGKTKVKPGRYASIPIKYIDRSRGIVTSNSVGVQRINGRNGSKWGFPTLHCRNKSEAVVYHDRGPNEVTILKNVRIGYFEDSTVNSYHASATFGAEAYQNLAECAEDA